MFGDDAQALGAGTTCATVGARQTNLAYVLAYLTSPTSNPCFLVNSSTSSRSLCLLSATSTFRVLTAVLLCFFPSPSIANSSCPQTPMTPLHHRIPTLPRLNSLPPSLTPCTSTSSSYSLPPS